MGLGHPLLDIMSHVDDLYLEKYSVPLGSCNLAEKKQLPIFEDLSQRRDVEFVPGGAAMNAIRVAKWMSSETTVRYIGALGDDEFGGILERALVKCGVVPFFEYHEEKPTGTCACLVVNRERSLLANLGAAVELRMEHIVTPEVEKAIAASDVFYFEGFFLNTVSSPANFLHFGDHCLRNNKVISFNLSAPYLCHIFKDRLHQVLPYVDIVFGSRIDILAYAEANEWPEKDLVVIMKKLADLQKLNLERKRIVIITGGHDSTFVATSSTVSEFRPPVVPPEEIVDTNGAGDAFVGGFLSQFLYDRPLETCIKGGFAAAAQVIRNNGCTYPEVPPEVK